MRADDAISCTEGRAHRAHACADRAARIREIARFFREGVAAGEPGVALARGETWAALKDALGPDAEMVVHVEAKEALGRISSAGRPDRERFEALLLPLVESSPRPRFYGELVDLLREAGRIDEAARLEGFWNDLGRDYPFRLLCGYQVDLLGSEGEALARICGTHEAVAFEYDARRLERAMKEALADVLGPERAGRLGPLIAASARPPGASDAGAGAVLWTRRNLPGAEEILRRARAIYEARP